MEQLLRVLHLEDDPDFTALVSAMLEKEGLRAQISAAENYPQFVAALERDLFDIILADYLLPTCNGLEALHTAQEKCPDTPFLLVSGTIGERAAVESLGRGATDYVLKNGLDRLVPAVRRAVSEARERAQRRHAETELVRREKYFRTLTENSLDVLSSLNGEGVFQYNSPSLKAVMGYDPTELAGRSAFEFVHPDDLAAARAAFGRALENPRLRVTQEFRFRHGDGSWRWLEAVGQNRLDDPDIAGVVLNSRDISARKRAEAEVRESGQQYRLIFDGNPVPMWVSDLDTHAILEVNAAAVRHYGYTREEFLAMTSLDIRPPDEVAKLEEYFAEVVKKRSRGCIGHAGLWRHRKKDGMAIDVEITWSIIAYKGGEAVLSMANDVTERRRNERREAALSRLSRGLSFATSPTAAAHLIKDVAGDLFGWDCFALGLYAPETDTLRPVLKVDTLEGRRQEILVERLRDKPDAVVRRVMENGAELTRECPTAPADETDLFRNRTRSAASRMFATLRNGSKVIGVLSLQSYQPNVYSEQDLSTLQILADHCAGALERIHAEQALRESEKRFRELFEGSPDAIVVTDLNARVLDANPAACRLWGTPLRQVIGRNLTAFAPPRREQEITLNLGKLMAGAVGQLEGVSLAADGREIPIEVSGNCIEYGERQAILLHVRDIRERKQAAEALKHSEAGLAAAQRIAHLGSWELDLVNEENIYSNELRWSDETFRIFGLEPRQVPVSTDLFFQFVHPEDRQRVAEAAERAFYNRDTYDTEHRIIAANGEERIVRERAEVVLDDNGKPVQMQGIVVDITERKRLEEQLRQAQKMEAIGQLAGGVAHDFNNILTVIHGHASLLSSDNDLPAGVARSSRQIVEAAERAAGLTRQLLTFSRRQVMQPRCLDLNGLVSDMTMMLGRILGEDIALELNYCPQPAFIRADASMIEQVLLNLAVNARDALPKGGQLTVRISIAQITAAHLATHPEARVGDFACLSVVDNGAGIAPDNMRRIFEPFFTTKEVGKGTGLGLATVYGIVKQHQGWIEVESQLGAGTVFRVYLPVTAESGAPSEKQAGGPVARGGQETVLVVEDEHPVRELVCKVLGNLGYRILQAESGAEAVTVWRRNGEKVDLLLTDLVMPDRMNGRELAEQLRAAQPSLKVIFTSGYSAEVVGDDFVLQKGLHYLQKPYDPQRLILTVRECLDTPVPAGTSRGRDGI